MGGHAADQARQREREMAEAVQLTQLPPTDPIRRAKAIDGVPAAPDEGAPNGTAGKADGAGETTEPSGGAEGQPTPQHMPEVQPTTAKDSRPAKPEGAPGLSSKAAERASTAKPTAKPRKPSKK